MPEAADPAAPARGSDRPLPPPSTSPAALGPAGAERLTHGVIWAYSLPRVGVGIMGILFGTYLMKFATDVLFVAPAVMGLLISASRLWDAVSDPMAGYLSDRTRSSVGRRRVWLYASAVPMGLGLVMIWSPPVGLGPSAIVVWMAVALLVYETASTAFFIPHGALGVELTPNYHERTRLFGYSHMISAIGMLLGLVALQLVDGAEDKRTTLFGLSMAAGTTVALIVLATTRVLPERADYQGRGSTRIAQSYLDVFRNPYARLLLVVYGIETFGAASVGMLVPYLTEYVLAVDGIMVPILITYTLPQFVFTPFWVRLARRVGKKRLWIFSMVLTSATFSGIYLLLVFPWVVWPGAFLLGIAAGCGAVVAPSINADVIDYDEYRTSQRKEGSYLALWNLVRKGAASVTALVTGLVLQAVDFEPNVAQTERVQLAIVSLFAGFPALSYAVGAALLARFDFNEAEHAAVREALASRRRAEARSSEAPPRV